MADLQTFLGENDWANARALIKNLEELEYDTQPFKALYNRAWFLENIMKTPGISFKSV